MIQLAVVIAGDVPASPPPPLSSTPTPAGVRLVGVWEGRDLAGARAELADVLATLPPDTAVTDALLALTEPAAAAVERLRAPPALDTAFAVRSFQWRGLRFLRLFGLAQLARADVFLEVEGDVSDAAALELFGHLVRYQLVTGRAVGPGEFLPYGWWLLSFASERLYDAAFWDAAGAAELGPLDLPALDPRLEQPRPVFVIEARRMEPGGQLDWVVGASRALRVMRAQQRAHARLAALAQGEAPALAVPFAQDPAVACARLSGSDAFFCQRLPAQTADDSGWHFGCVDPDHVHDESALTFTTVGHLAGAHPELVQYLALPPGWLVSRDEDGAFWVQPPGDERSFRDEGAAGDPWEPATPEVKA